MKKLTFCVCGAILALLAPSSLFANTIFNFGFSTSYNRGNVSQPYSGSGQLDTVATSTPGVYLIVGATGTIIFNPYADTITGVASVGNGRDNLLTVIGGYATIAGNDSAKFITNKAPAYLSPGGTGDVSFSNALYTLQYPPTVRLTAFFESEQGSIQRQDYALASFYATQVAPSAAATPEPSTFVLLATGGLGVIGALRRKRAA